MKVYILGPMRDYKWFNFPAFDSAADRLRERGYTPISPADIDRSMGFNPFALPEDWDWHTIPDSLNLKEIIARDLAALGDCRAYVALPGWEHSVGACAELAVAKWHGLTQLVV